MKIKSEQIKIPSYSADDFLKSTAPYEFLYQFHGDKFLMSQLEERMKIKAAEKGIKAFPKIWKEYLKSSESNKNLIENHIKMDGQNLDLFSGPYICDEYGVAIIDRYGNEKIICEHPIFPIERIINIDTNEERLKIAFKRGNPDNPDRKWKEIIVEKSIIASSSTILQLSTFGILVNSENAKILSSYLFEIEQLNYDYIPERRATGKLGWIGNEFSPYVKDLDFDGEGNFKYIFSSVKENGSRKKWIEAMIDLRESKAPGSIFLATSFASALIEPCGLLPFFLHAWGGTGTGKTVGLKIAASVWACPKIGEYITTFNSTTVGQEMMASFLNSLPMCIDELQIQSSMGIKDFDKIIYSLTEGAGKTRGSKNGGIQKINTWKNCFITNGEHPISNSNSGGGAINRIIEIECIEKIYHDLIGLSALLDKNYGFAGKEFINYIQQDGVIESASFIQKEFYRELLKYDSTEKQAISASAILTADSIATSIIFKDNNALTVNDLLKIMIKKSDVDINRRAKNFLIELIARNPGKFRNEAGEFISESWGKITESHICIIKSIFNREMKNEGFNPDSFLSWAKRTNMIDTEKNRNTRKIKINGNPTNCVCLIKNRIFQ